MVPIHPPVTGRGGESGGMRTYSCLKMHEKNPGFFPKGLKETKKGMCRHHNVDFSL